MQISNNFGISASNALQSAGNANNKLEAATKSTQATGLNPTDQLDFSPEAQAIISGEGPSQADRTSRIASIRSAIAEGSYDTPERLSAALDKFLLAY